MTIPDFQSIMLPLLQTTSDGQVHRQAEVRETLAEYFRLREVEIKEKLPSGRQGRFDNRVAWARVYSKGLD